MPPFSRSWPRSALAALGLALAGCGGGEERDEPVRDTLRYGVIGDSYSNGEGLGPEQAWPVDLAQRLDAELVANPAVSGYTADDAIAAELGPFTDADPEVATLMIGANDAFGGRSPGAFRRSFRRLLESMARVVGDARRIVVVTIPDFRRKPLGVTTPPAPIEAFNDVIRAEARRAGAPVADVFPASRRATAPSPDGLHPAASELDAWTDAIAPVARRAWRGLE